MFVILADTGGGEVGGHDLPDGVAGVAERKCIARPLGNVSPEVNPEVWRQDRSWVAAVVAEEGAPPADFHDGIGGGADPVVGGDLLAAIDGGFVPAVEDIRGRGKDGRLIPFDDLAGSCGGTGLGGSILCEAKNGGHDGKSHRE